MLNYIRNKFRFGWNATPNKEPKKQKSSRFAQVKSFLTRKHNQYFNPGSKRKQTSDLLHDFGDSEKDDVYNEAMKFKKGGNLHTKSRKRRARRTRRN